MEHVRYYLAQVWVIFLILLISILYAVNHASPTAPPPISSGGIKDETTTDPYILKTIEVINQDDRWHVVLTGSESMTYEASKTVDPLGLKVDLPNTVINPEALPRNEENEIVGRIKASVLISGPQPLTQIWINLNKDVPYVIHRAQGKIWVSFDKSYLQTVAEPVQIEPVEKSKAKDFAGSLEAATPATTLEEVTLSSVQPTKREPVRPAHEVTAIKSIKSDEELRIYILADGSLAQYHTFLLNNPPRLVMDFMEVKSTKVRGVQSVKGSLVKRIRVGLHPEKLRVVFDLVSEKEPSYQIILGDDRLVISLKRSVESSPH